MAAIRDYAVTIETGTVTSLVCDMPEHSTGDLLLVFASKDGTPAINLPSGYTDIRNGATTGHYQRVCAKRAASSGETLTVTTGTAESFTVVVVAVKNCYGTTVADAVPDSGRASVDDSTLPFDGGSITPSYNNSLVFGMFSGDSGLGTMGLPGWVSIFGGDDGGSSLSVTYTYQKTAATLTHPGYWAGGADDGRYILLAVRDNGSETEVSPYLDRGTTPTVLVSSMTGANVPDLGTWQAAASVQLLTVASRTVTGVTIAAAADSGNIPFRGAARHISPSSKTNLGASQLNFTAAKDLSAGIGVIFGTFRPQLPRDYLDLGTAARGGAFIRLMDASDNWKAWVVAGQFSLTTDPSNKQNYAVEVGSTDTVYDANGTLTTSAVNRLQIGGSGYFGAASLEWSELYLLNKCVIAGGTPSVPLTILDLEAAVNGGNGRIPLLQRVGSAATLWTPIQFGGGDPVHIGVSLRTFQFPRKADEADYLDFHVSNNVMGVEFHGQDRGSGDVDTLKFIGCVFSSDSPYYWRFNASHDADADIDFNGCTVVGASVTLRSTVALSGVTFSRCGSFAQNGATLSGCTFNDTKVSSDTLDDMALISDSVFTSGGTGHAIEVSGPADTITLNGVTFDGYASSDGSTGNEAIYVNIASGTVTINISGGGSTPSIRTAGATVTVNNSVTLTLTGLISGSDIVILSAGTSTEFANVDSHGSTTYDYSYSYSAGTYVDVGVFKIGYVPFYVRNYLLSASDASLPISQVVDRNYANPA